MIKREKNCFVLETLNTTYCFQVMKTGHLEHLYYGRKISISEGKGVKALVEKQVFIPGNLNAYDEKYSSLSLEDVCLEMSSYGKEISGSLLLK